MSTCSVNGELKVATKCVEEIFCDFLLILRNLFKTSTIISYCELKKSLRESPTVLMELLTGCFASCAVLEELSQFVIVLSRYQVVHKHKACSLTKDVNKCGEILVVPCLSLAHKKARFTRGMIYRNVKTNKHN